jgi:hypothetical protein
VRAARRGASCNTNSPARPRIGRGELGCRSCQRTQVLAWARSYPRRVYAVRRRQHNHGHDTLSTNHPDTACRHTPPPVLNESDAQHAPARVVVHDPAEHAGIHPCPPIERDYVLSMFSQIAERASQQFDRRFLLNAFLPVLFAVLALLLVLTSSLRVPFTEAWQWLSELTAITQLLLSAAIIAVVWFLAGLLASNWRKIVRLYEGYPLRLQATSLARALARNEDERDHFPRRALDYIPGIPYHRAERRRLLLGGRQLDLYAKYPGEDHLNSLLPSQVGNTLLSGELYGLDRYSFDLNLLWPRLAHLIPEQAALDLDRFKEEHQFPLILSFVCAAFSVLAGSFVLVATGPWNLFVLVTLTGLLLAYGSYLLSLERTDEYAEQLRAITDLYRHELRNYFATNVDLPEDDRYFTAAASFVLHGDEHQHGTDDAWSQLWDNLLEENGPTDPLDEFTGKRSKAHRLILEKDQLISELAAFAANRRTEPALIARLARTCARLQGERGVLARRLHQPRLRRVRLLIRRLVVSKSLGPLRRGINRFLTVVRLRYIALTVGVSLIATGGLWLFTRQTEVFIASANLDPFQTISSTGNCRAEDTQLVACTVRRGGVPRDAISSTTDVFGRLTLKGLEPGQIIRTTDLTELPISTQVENIVPIIATVPDDLPSGSILRLYLKGCDKPMIEAHYLGASDATRIVLVSATEELPRLLSTCAEDHILATVPGH